MYSVCASTWPFIAASSCARSASAGEIQLPVQRIQSEEVAMCLSRWRTRPVVADLAEAVAAVAASRRPSGRSWRRLPAEMCVERGTFHNTQCTHTPAGASGSSMMMAKLAVLAGAPLQRRAGEMSSPLHVYCLGISAPGAKAEVVRVKAMAAPPFAGEPECCATLMIEVRTSRDARFGHARITTVLSTVQSLIHLPAFAGRRWLSRDRPFG